MLEISQTIVQQIAQMPVEHSWAAQVMRTPIEMADEMEARMNKKIRTLMKEMYPRTDQAERMVRIVWMLLLENKAIQMYQQTHPMLQLPIVETPQEAVALAEQEIMWASEEDKKAAEEFLTKMQTGEINLLM